ncbi:MAG: LacI family DNA-binding transcriptional regulator [Microbacteriaceae bacterium]
MASLPTVEDVARVASVSRQTVSNVLNSPQIVKSATRLRVQEAIAELGYRPHASARRLRTQKSSTIGIRLEPVRNGISGSVLDTFLHALTEQADSRGMRILLFTADTHAEEIEQIRRLKDGADVDGFVLTSTEYGDERVQWLIDNNVPFATFGRPWGADEDCNPKHRWVDVDGRAGVREATAHLIASGLRRIGYIGWPAGSGAGDDRHRGWIEAMSAAGLDAEGLDHAVDDTVASGSHAADTLLGSGNPPEALVCASDTLALGARLAASALGRDAMPIIGFDNTPVANAVGLSSIEQPLEAVAAGVLDLLLGPTGSNVRASASANEEPTHRLLVPRLVERNFTQLRLGGTPGL